jgi:hypothetical protein
VIISEEDKALFEKWKHYEEVASYFLSNGFTESYSRTEVHEAATMMLMLDIARLGR